MKKLFPVIFLFFYSVVSGQLMGPKVSTQDSEFDFGNIVEGEIVSHKFTIYNTGDDILKIEKVKASCGCTVAKPQKDELAPGEATEINVEFNSARRNGVQKKYVYVFTNDPNSSELRLSFTANIISKKIDDQEGTLYPKLILGKTQHNFGTVNEGDILDLSIEFKNTGNSTLEIKDVTSSCGCTAVLLSSKKLDPGETGNLKIEVDTSNRSGRITRTVTILSNDPVDPKQVLILYMNIVKGNT
jgi:hypothetical protein